MTLTTLNKDIIHANRYKAIFIAGLVLILFAKPLYQLAQVWMNDADYSHGFFVIPISIYMLWLKRSYWLNAEMNRSWLGFSIFAMGTFLYSIGIITNFNSLVYLAIVQILLGLCMFLLGLKTAMKVIGGVLFLIFMIPIPSALFVALTNPLKLIITDISSFLIQMTGIPVYQEGNLLMFANTQLEVAEACSGVRSIYSYLMLSFVFTLFCIRKITRVVLVLSVVPLAMLVNVVRVSGTGILSHYMGDKAAQGFFHEFAGFLLFAVGLVLMYIIYWTVEKPHKLNKQQ